MDGNANKANLDTLGYLSGTGALGAIQADEFATSGYRYDRWGYYEDMVTAAFSH
jgi:hypothetical protein